MKKYSQFPPLLLARTIRLCLLGRIRFPKDRNGSIVKENDDDYIIFRKVFIRLDDKPDFRPAVKLKVFFRFKSFSLNVNRILSLIPIPFIIAQPGFCSKTWMFGIKTGTFHGLYEWDSREDAQHYWDSLPLRLMKKRAKKDTLEFKIF